MTMAKLIYTTISSLDGYVADDEGNFEWSAPDEEVHRFINDLERPIGTYLFGRRLYEVMRYWETAPTGDGELSAEQNYAQISALHMVVVRHEVGLGRLFSRGAQ